MRLSLTQLRRAVVIAIGVLVALAFVAEIADAQRRGGGGRGGGRGGGGRGGGGRAARANVNRDFSRGARPAQREVNRGVNRDVNRNRDINRNVDVDRDWDLDVDVDDDWYYPGRVAGAAVAAAAIGSIVYNLPSSCVTQVVNGIAYRHCNGTWYEPQFEGSTVTYVVVSPP